MTNTATTASATSTVQETVSNATNAAESAAQAVAADPGWFSEMIHSGAMGYLLEGGIFMWPILIMGILMLGVIIERWRSLKMLRTDTTELREGVLNHLMHNNTDAALQLADSSQGPVAAVLSTGLRKYKVLQALDYDPGRIEEQVTKSMENYGVHILAALERHLPVLAIVSSVAPMLGFLGTVQGMIIAFAEISSNTTGANIVQLAASGIQTALLTTCFGLIIGIPAFIAFNYFTSVINRFVLDVEETATELMEAVTLQVTLGAGSVTSATPDAASASSPPAFKRGDDNG